MQWLPLALSWQPMMPTTTILGQVQMHNQQHPALLTQYHQAMGTLCTAKKPLIYGDGDTLHRQKAPHKWRWGHFALPKSPSYMAMGTLYTAKKPLIHGDVDTLHCQKSPSHMTMGTLYTAKKPLINGDGDTLHYQKAPHIWRWGHFTLPKSPSSPSPYMRGFFAV